MNKKSVDYDLRINYYALMASILSDKSVEESLQYFNLQKKISHLDSKCSQLTNLICVLIFCGGMTKGDVAKTLHISRELVNTALVQAKAPHINWVARHKRLLKYNKERE